MSDFDPENLPSIHDPHTGKTKRERAALFVLIFLGLAALSVAIAYIIVGGHNLNVAATSIDDTSGDLSGYTVILYDGTAVPDARTPGASSQPTSLSTQYASYCGKKAHVMRINTVNPQVYAKGRIVLVGNRKVGVMSVLDSTKTSKISAQAKALKKKGAGYVVAIVDKDSTVDDAKNIDIVISLSKHDDNGLIGMGDSKNGTFYTVVPSVGSIGCILISPSNAVSTKSIGG